MKWLLSLVFILPALGQPPEPRDGRRPPRREPAQRYSLEQATSDRAQLHTIAFDGLAFLTGDFAADTFLPPGKVSDYFGFQYMRDVDAGGLGHNTSFLTLIAQNMLALLDGTQRARLVALAREQAPDIRRFAELRLPLIDAFRRHLEARPPAGRAGLDRAAVLDYSAQLYELDARLAWRRAQVMAEVLRGLSPDQRRRLALLHFADSRTWPPAAEVLDRRSLPHDVHVAVMTYASEMFSWQAGSLDADVYFCPERHGMYFGGFGMKTAPAMGRPSYSISTSLTGDSGEALLAALDATQRRLITGLVEAQRADLAAIVECRRAIAAQLRLLFSGQTADLDQLLTSAHRYGELDGSLSLRYANAFAAVARTLSPAQRQALAALRGPDEPGRRGPFLYSEPVPNLKINSSDAFFQPSSGPSR